MVIFRLQQNAALLHWQQFSHYDIYRSLFCMNSGWSTSTFLSLSLFVVTKSNQKRPDKKNSLRLRLRSNSFLSQQNYLFTLRAHGRTLNLTTKEPKSCLINLQGGQHAPDLCLAGQSEGVNILRIFTKPRQKLKGGQLCPDYPLSTSLRSRRV